MFAKINFVYICLKIFSKKTWFHSDQMSPLSRFFYFSIFLNFDTVCNQTNASIVKSVQRRHQLKFHKVQNHLKQFQRSNSSETFNSNYIVSYSKSSSLQCDVMSFYVQFEYGKLPAITHVLSFQTARRMTSRRCSFAWQLSALLLRPSGVGEVSTAIWVLLYGPVQNIHEIRQ